MALFFNVIKSNAGIARIGRDWRFERCARLLGAAAMDKLASSHVAVFVTSVFGMAAASAAVRMLLSMDPFSRKME